LNRPFRVDRTSEGVAEKKGDFRREIKTPDMNVGRRERANHRPIGDARPFRVRRGQRLRQHGEAGEQQRRIEDRLRERLADHRRRRHCEGRRQIGQGINADHVEALHLANDEQTARQDKGQQREIAAHPPGRGLVEQQRRGGDADRDRIENMLAANRQCEFRGDGDDRGQDQSRDAEPVRGCDGRQNQREDERGDIDGFRVRRHAHEHKSLSTKTNRMIL
jgi:hypothetical protein